MAMDYTIVMRSEGPDYDWNPNEITIAVGDTIIFRNFSSTYITVSQYSGDCDSYVLGPISGQPYPGAESVTFDTGPCDSYFEDDMWDAQGVIHVVTPTPNPFEEFPSMSPSGITITLIIISLALVIGVVRKSG